MLIMAPLLIVVAIFVIYPMLKLAYDSFTLGDGLGNYAAVFQSGATRKAFVTTLWSSILVTLISVAMGAVVAWWIRAVQNRWIRSLILLSVILPFCMGIVIKNYAFAIIFSRTGVLNELLQWSGLTDTPITIMYTPFAVNAGMVYSMLPFAILALLASYMTIDLNLVTAAKSMGASKIRSAFTVILPLAVPGIMASFTIVFAICVGFYITPIVLGGAQTPFVASLIGDDLFRHFNYPRAAATGVILLVVALTILLVGLRMVGGRAMKGVLSR